MVTIIVSDENDGHTAQKNSALLRQLVFIQFFSALTSLFVLLITYTTFDYLMLILRTEKKYISVTDNKYTPVVNFVTQMLKNGSPFTTKN